MQIDPVPFELEVVVVPAFDHPPGFVIGDVAHPLQDLVGDARPAIGEALVLVERSERGDTFRTIEDHEMSSLATNDFPIIYQVTDSHRLRVKPDQGSGASP